MSGASRRSSCEAVAVRRLCTSRERLPGSLLSLIVGALVTERRVRFDGDTIGRSRLAAGLPFRSTYDADIAAASTDKVRLRGTRA